MSKLQSKWGCLLLSLTVGAVTPLTTVGAAVTEAQTVTTANSLPPVDSDDAVARLVATTASAVSDSAVSSSAPVTDSGASSVTASSSAVPNTAASASETTSSAAVTSATTSGEASRAATETAVTKTTATTDDAVATGISGTVNWTIGDDGVLHLSAGSFGTLPSSVSLWNSYAAQITSISIEGAITAGTGATYARLFSGLPNVTTITGLKQLSLAGVTNVSYMFYNDTSLTSVDFGDNDFSSVTTMLSMFQGCTKLTAVGTAWTFNKVTNLANVFYNCAALTTVNTRGWDISNVTTLSGTFSGCKALTAIDVSDWQTGNVTALTNTFANCTSLTTLAVGNWDTSKLTSLNSTFSNCSHLTTLNVSKWKMGNVTTLASAFNGCSNLTTLPVGNWDVSKVTTLSYTFTNCKSLTSLDIRQWQTPQLVTFSQTFQNASSLTALDFSGTGWDTSKVTSMFGLFNGTGLETLDLSQLTTANVTNFGSTFYGMTKLTTLNLASWDTSAATSYKTMFGNSQNLQHLTLGEKFTFHGDTSMALTSGAITNGYTGDWQLGDDGPAIATDDLMTTYDGSTMAGQYNWVKVPTKSTVTVKYVDTVGETVSPAVTYTGMVGSDYTFAPKVLAGYTLTTTPANATGVYTADPITVTYVYTGNLIFSSVPSMVSFGRHTLTGQSATYGANLDQELVVKDNRSPNASWTLSAQLGASGFVNTATGDSLAATLTYRDALGTATVIGNVATPIVTQMSTSNNPVSVSSDWSTTTGLLLTAQDSSLIGTYQAEITWDLGDTVANN
ncbi:BspA family leucine-rich repeat surface protein [Lactobacillus sp. CBA3606]|uniref:BspA family leucine-rich repeat surface protein n=1 Tax=Lactobacillus sp. CBA3606 TaxID=2099789 RepID=UPI00131A2FD0|nr:BspA family leucine-rich repeat surface protein [Lactobacillus sp. CBA3606]